MNTIKFITEDDSFNLKGFIDEVKSSSKNSRSALISLVLVSFFVFMTLINTSSKKYNWYKDRRELALNVYQNVIFQDELGKTTIKLNNFLKLTENVEGHFPRDRAKYKRYLNYLNCKPENNTLLLIKTNKFQTRKLSRLKTYSSFSQRKKIYDEYLKIIKYCNDRAIESRSDIIQHIQEINKNKSENIDVVKVPILGIAFDINYIGFYSGLMILLMIWLLYAAMNREHVNTKITFKKAWSESHFNHFIFYEFMSMSQMLHEPKKLFEYKKFNSGKVYTFVHKSINNKISRIFIYLSSVAVILLTLNHFYKSHGDALKNSMGNYIYILLPLNYLVCGCILLIIPFLPKKTSKHSIKNTLKKRKTDKPGLLKWLIDKIRTISINLSKNNQSDIFFNNKIDLSYLEVMRLIAILFPLIVYYLVFVNDVNSAETGELLNINLTYTTIFIESIFCSLILFYCIQVNSIKVQITDLWTNRAITFNFKYILGAYLSMEDKFELDKNSKSIKEIFRFNKHFPDLGYNEEYEAEYALTNIQDDSEKKIIEQIYANLMRLKEAAVNENSGMVDEIELGDEREILFNKIKFILKKRNELYYTVNFGNEYKSMGTYADDNKPLEIKDLNGRTERRKYIKQMCIICILEIIKDKTIDNNPVDNEWNYQDKKMATIHLRNYINKILSINKDDIDKNTLALLLSAYEIEDNGQIDTLVDLFWNMLTKSYTEASNNSIANNSFYHLFDEIESILLQSGTSKQTAEFTEAD